MFPNDFPHSLGQFIMLLPLSLHDENCVVLCVGVHDVDFDRLSLHEPIDSMHRLNEVIELICRADEDGFMAVTLEVAAASE